MAPDDEVIAYATDLQQEVLLDAEVEGADQLRPDVFTRLMVERIVDAGEAENLEPCYLKMKGAEVSAYGIDDGDTLNLVGTIYRGEVPPPTVTNADLQKVTARLLGFWDRCRRGSLHESLEESSDAYEMARVVHLAAAQTRRLRLFVVTDGITRSDRLIEAGHEDLGYTRSIWDLTHIYRLDTSGAAREPIVIDFVERFGSGLPCLPSQQGADGYDAMLLVFPGPVLADIYEEFGPRLLELNVRSYLQAAGKVNKGMRATLREQPGRFLAYNNGISATAAAVELVDLPGGGVGVGRLHDLQIVNGGQTTASVHRARYRDRVDVSTVGVQAKVTVVPKDVLNEVVPLISRFANSQNRVSEADLSSNDPFHVQIEALSRTVWTPATGVGIRQTRWFYERARGQYRDAENREGTPSKRRLWRETHPTSQRFTKTDIAKYWNAWDQLPHEVSKGAQKNFTVFMNGLRRQPLAPDVGLFQQIVARGILWRRTEKLVSEHSYVGYRANLVAYAIAKLSRATGQRLDLERIWLDQGPAPAVEDALIDLAALAWDVVVDGGPAGGNVTEWAKRKECWHAMRDAPWTLPAEIEPLLTTPTGAASTAVAGTVADANVAACQAVAPERWFELADWAKQTSSLESWQRSLAVDIGKRIKRGRAPSVRQAGYGVQILEEAARSGFAEKM